MKRFLAFLMIFLALSVLAVQAAEKDPKQTEPEPINYKKYLDNPEELGMRPHPHLFPQIVRVLHGNFYGNVDDAKLVASMKSEIAQLCKAAGIPDPLENKSFADPMSVYEAALTIPGITQELLTYTCITGILRGTGDRFTAYMTPREYGLLMEQLQSSSFGGIGIIFTEDTKNRGRLTVTEAIEGTPAYEAGLQTGDVIIEIDGVSTVNVPSDVSSVKMRGPKGTPVTLTIERKGVTGIRKYTIYRDIIQVKSVRSKKLGDDTGYIKVSNFGEHTAREFEAALKELSAQGIKGLIVDLRNNGGGYVNAAVDLCSMFIPSGETIVSVKDKEGKGRTYNSKNNYKTDMPVILMVNNYSASASEITAGAIKDYKRGLLLGTKTFGKGSVQQMIPFGDGSALKITLSHYFTPNNNHIDTIGLEPDIQVEDADAQMSKAEEVMHKLIREGRV